ncbi:uncharacterized protein METZ01_LOCUS338030 [marine metagenome]|uniref:Uncharacterized protein n=1 Tax=marine metagenome TaxID=408172 RepID=A0A382QIB3_9ZZZZ
MNILPRVAKSGTDLTSDTSFFTVDFFTVFVGFLVFVFAILF